VLPVDQFSCSVALFLTGAISLGVSVALPFALLEFFVMQGRR